MSILNSKFDIVSVDNPLAVAALAQVLEVGVFANAAAPSPAELSALYSNAPGDAFMGGTPQTPPTFALLPGTVVMMDAAGKAVKAEAPVLQTAGAVENTPVLPFVTIDGNTDYSGRFVRKITVFQGGFTMATDQYDNTVGTFDIGNPVTFSAGKIVPRKGVHAGKQMYGFVGPAGFDSVNGVLQVIVPQGVSY